MKDSYETLPVETILDLPNGPEKEPEDKDPDRDSSEIDSEDGQKRGEWGNSLDFLFSCISYCVGLGNVWRFPYLCYKHGGGAFLLCYGISTILCGIPFMMLEIALGQFFGVAQIASLAQLCPILKGAGYSSLIMQFYINLYFPVIIAWALFYLFASFSRLPNDDVSWAHCDHTWNTDKCVEVGANISRHENVTSSVEEFWNVRVLGITDSLDEVGSMRWELCLMLFLGWGICYLVVWKGLHSSGKIIWFTATFPYVILTILLGRAVTLEGASKGLEFFITPQWHLLKHPGPWIEGGTQIFYSFGVGMGSLIALGSYNKFKHNLYRDALVVGCVNVFTSMYAGIVTFSVLGYMATQYGVEVGDVVKSGPGLSFLVYPEVVTTLPGSPAWAILFFAMLLILGIDSQFCGIEACVAGCMDNWPWLRSKKFLFTLVSCVVTMLMALPMVTQGGPYIFELVNIFSASGMSLLWAVTFQVIAVNWLWGSDKVYAAIYQMTGVKLTPFWMICWKFVGPVFMICIFIFYFVLYEPPYYEDLPYSTTGQVIGLLISGSSMIMIPGYAVYYVMSSDKPFYVALKEGFTPKIQLRPEATDLDQTLKTVCSKVSQVPMLQDEDKCDSV